MLGAQTGNTEFHIVCLCLAHRLHVNECSVSQEMCPSLWNVIIQKMNAHLSVMFQLRGKKPSEEKEYPDNHRH